MTHRLEADAPLVDAPLIDAPLMVVYQREVHCHRFSSITMCTESSPEGEGTWLHDTFGWIDYLGKLDTAVLVLEDNSTWQKCY